MQMAQAIIKSHPQGGQIDTSLLTEKSGGWLTRLFGCWHTEMSRPFSSQSQTYRVCLNCGARRQFSVGRWEMQGDFYYGLPVGKLSRL